MTGLHIIIFYICCAIAGLVFAFQFYAMFRFRLSKKRFGMDIVWAIVPVVISAELILKVIQ